MTVRELLQLTNMLTQELLEDDGGLSFGFEKQADDVYPVYRIFERRDGTVILRCNKDEDETLNILKISSKLGAFKMNAKVLCEIVDEDGDSTTYELDDDAYVNGDGVALVGLQYDDEEDDDGFVYYDLTGGGERDTATVAGLIAALRKGNGNAKLFVDDGDCLNSTLDAIFHMRGTVVLQSNETKQALTDDDVHEFSMTTDFVLHCVDWFDKRLKVQFMNCDVDNDYVFYNVISYYFDEDDTLRLRVEEA